MAINKKLIRFATKAKFKEKLEATPISEINDYSIVFIDDTGEIWTHGRYYGGIYGTKDSQKATLTIAGTAYNLSVDGHNHSLPATNEVTDDWALFGRRTYLNTLPEGLINAYNYGQLLSFCDINAKFQMYVSHRASEGEGIRYRSGWDVDKRGWATIWDTGNFNPDSKANTTHTHNHLNQDYATLDLNSLTTINTFRYDQVLSDSTNIFPIVNNANAVLTIGTYPGEGYFHQLGFSANGNMYHRYSTGNWFKVFASDNFTNLNQLPTRNFSDLQNKPTTLSGYGITDYTSHNSANGLVLNNSSVNAIGYAASGSVSLFGQTDGGFINTAYSSDWQSQIFQDFRTGQIALRGKNSGTWTGWRTVYDSGNSNLTSIPWSVSSLTMNGALSGATTGNFTQYAQFASTNIWGVPIQIGRMNANNMSNAIPIIGATDGNLHLDSGLGHDIYLQYYQTGGSGSIVHIGSNGNVGIGTTQNSSYKLYVNGNQYTNGTGRFTGKLILDAAEGLGVAGIRGTTANEQVEMYQKVSIGSPNGWGGFPQAPTFGLSVYGGANFCTNQGNVLIGTTTDAGYKLDVNGTFRATGNVTAPNFYGYLNGNISGTATQVVATVTGTNTIELVIGNIADNDFFRILVGGTASNAGYAEIATADDANEPIYVRQYTGVFTSLARTATLLDESGNTSFPQAVSGSRFYTGYDSGVANSISCSNWFRSNGSSGWMNATYGGGIYCDDTTWVKVYNNKGIYTAGNLLIGGTGNFNGSQLVLRGNSVESHSTNGVAELSINYYGYNAGYTQYRNLAVYNGKCGINTFFDGVNGRVGIGTNAPTDTLDVRGTGKFTGNVTAPSFIGNASSSTQLSSTLPQIAAATESNIISVIDDGNGAITVNSPNAGIAAIRHGFSFKWYSDDYHFGIIRGGGSESQGLGITQNSSNLLWRVRASDISHYVPTYTQALKVQGELTTTKNIYLNNSSENALYSNGSQISFIKYDSSWVAKTRLTISDIGINVVGALASDNFIEATSFIKTGGTASQVLLGDGSTTSIDNLKTTVGWEAVSIASNGRAVPFYFIKFTIPGTAYSLINVHASIPPEFMLNWNSFNLCTGTIPTAYRPGENITTVIFADNAGSDNDTAMIKFMWSGSVYIYGTNIASVGNHQFNITYLGY